MFLAVITFSPLAAQGNNFIGVYGGISTLSADARTVQTGETTQFSTYKPENGPTAVFFGGRHLNNYFSLMGSYGWNRNKVLMNSGAFTTSQSFWEQPRRVTMHTVLGEGLLYFRNLQSRFRPYLSAGFGVTHTGNDATEPPQVRGAAVPPPNRFSDTSLAFRAAVGIDVVIRGGLAFRYSFSETIQSNVTSKQLTPPGERNLANFQNWFGFSYRF